MFVFGRDQGYGGNWRITFGFLLQNSHFQKNVISYGINDKDKMTSKTTVAPLTLMYQKTSGEHYRADPQYDISHIHLIIYVLSWGI